MKEDIEYPVRINRYLYLKNITSRRDADRLIEKGQVFVNGKRAVLGQKIAKEDAVSLSPGAKKKIGSYAYYIANKPRGVDGASPDGNQKDMLAMLPIKEKVYIVGQLDKDSSGLLFLTNDGRVVDRMLNPKYKHEKEYVVSTDKKLRESFRKKMESGVNIEGYVTKPARVGILGQKTFSIMLTEGKKHQIRRMLASLGYATLSLKRTRIMGLKIGNLKEGEHRALSAKEKSDLLSSLNMD